MSEEDDWEFAGDDDAKMTIRAAVRYLLKHATGSDRGDTVIGYCPYLSRCVLI